MRHLFSILFAAGTVLAGAAALGAAEPVSFNRDIRPILSANCFACHGPDEETRKAGLRLDQREGALREEDDIAAVVPGNPDASELVRRIHADDPDEVMPPPETNKQLTMDQKTLLRRWIAEGAPYERHWSFVPPRRPTPPAVRREDWPRNPIDRFILARLEEKGLSPSPEADRHTLIRRVFLDLTGLPPTPGQVDAFVGDPSPDAYPRLVHRLLQSSHYGERWARRWLDLARYADSNGYEKDRERSIWPYRDWVIRALNDDMPFDRFTIEQLAGDMLPDPAIDQLVATGFHRNTMLNEEGGIDPLEYRFHAMTDRVATTGTAWLGLTLGCAQCHTHKYDPITQREYYQIMALLNNADEPDLELPDSRLDRQHQADLRRAETLIEQLPDHWPVTESSWQTVSIIEARADNGEVPQRLEDGSVLFAQASPDRAVYHLTFETREPSVDRLRLEALTHPDLPSGGPGRVGHGNFVLTDVSLVAAPLGAASPMAEVVLASAKAPVEQPGFPASHAIDDKASTGWAVHDPELPLNRDRHILFTFAEPVRSEEGVRGTLTLGQQYGNRHTLGRIRLSLPSSGPRDDVPLAQQRARELNAAFHDWLDRVRPAAAAWTPLHPAKAESNLPLLTPQPDHSIFASGDTSKHDTYKLMFDSLPPTITAIRLEALPDPRLPAHGPGMTYYEGERGDFFLTEFKVEADGAPVALGQATESYAKNRFGNHPVSAQLALDGDLQTGWSVSGRVGERHVAVFVPEKPLSDVEHLGVTLHFGRHFASSLGRFRLSVTDDEGTVRALDLDAEVEELLLKPDAALAERERDRLRRAFLLQAPELAERVEKIRKLQAPPDRATTLVMKERPPENPRPTFLHHRGEFLQPTTRVEPGIPEVFPTPDSEEPENRLEFARWLFSRENPLTARVVVNRQWAAFFGRGLVRTVQDFGLQGDLPSHPGLLDWLAVEFRDSGWSLKHIHQLIVLSATYRQSSRVAPEALSADPENRLFSRAPRFRLEAEILRDQILKASGLLSEKMFGPPVRPPQPKGVTEVAYGKPAWKPSQGEDRYRRSIYTFLKRTAPFAMFNTFDAPSGEACVAQRDRSNSPLQALTLLNDVMLVEAAQAMGRSLAGPEGGTDADRVRRAFRRLLVRPPTEEETALLVEFVRDQRRRFASGDLEAEPIAGPGENVAERAAWTSLARALFNLDETVTRN